MQATRFNVTVDQMVSVVKWYVKEKLNRDIEIDMYSDSIMGRNKINPLVFNLHLNKLFKAYVKALEYYKKDYEKH